jgi:hypothetical protein
MGVGRGANNTYPVKKKIVEKPSRNSARFCGGGKGLSWAVEPRKEEENLEKIVILWTAFMWLKKIGCTVEGEL